MSKFLHVVLDDAADVDADDDNAKAISIPPVFSKNSQAKNTLDNENCSIICPPFV